MKAALLTMGLLLAAGTAAQAQLNVTIGTPDRGDYWRQQREGQKEAEWQRREEYRTEEAKREDWQHGHCVRDWQNHEYCRR